MDKNIQLKRCTPFSWPIRVNLCQYFIFYICWSAIEYLEISGSPIPRDKNDVPVINMLIDQLREHNPRELSSDFALLVLNCQQTVICSSSADMPGPPFWCSASVAYESWEVGWVPRPWAQGFNRLNVACPCWICVWATFPYRLDGGTPKIHSISSKYRPNEYYFQNWEGIWILLTSDASLSRSASGSPTDIMCNIHRIPGLSGCDGHCTSGHRWHTSRLKTSRTCTCLDASGWHLRHVVSTGNTT